MFRDLWTLAVFSAAVLAVGSADAADAQDRRTRLDAEHYVIDAEINPAAQTLTAQVQVRFVPGENTSTASFELKAPAKGKAKVAAK